MLVLAEGRRGPQISCFPPPFVCQSSGRPVFAPQPRLSPLSAPRSHPPPASIAFFAQAPILPSLLDTQVPLHRFPIIAIDC